MSDPISRTPPQRPFGQLEDRMAIAEQLYRYCHAMDRCDWDLAKASFHPDAYDDHGMYKGDVQGLMDFARERHRHIVMSMHLIGNILIEFAGDNLGLVESYCFVCQSFRFPPGEGREPSEFDTLAWVRYVDTFEKKDGVWKIARRITVFDKTMDVSSSDGGTARLVYNGSPRPRDRSDPYYTEREALGLH